LPPSEPSIERGITEEEINQLAKNNDYGSRSRSVEGVLGLIAPAQVDYPEDMSDERIERNLEISNALQERLVAVQDMFLSEHNGLGHSDKTWVVLDAYAAMSARWCCSSQMLENSAMDLGTALHLAAQMTQANFREKQNELFKKIGRFTH
jgi:hypothetical protein